MTGHQVKSPKQFSAENYNDQEDQKASIDPITKGKVITKVMTYCTAFFIDNIEVFKDKHWKRILEDARGHIKKNKWNTSVTTSSKSDDIVVVKAESNKRQRKIVVNDSKSE
jgi:hypothetical protein